MSNDIHIYTFIEHNYIMVHMSLDPFIIMADMDGNKTAGIIYKHAITMKAKIGSIYKHMIVHCGYMRHTYIPLCTVLYLL